MYKYFQYNNYICLMMWVVYDRKSKNNPFSEYSIFTSFKTLVDSCWKLGWQYLYLIQTFPEKGLPPRFLWMILRNSTTKLLKNKEKWGKTSILVNFEFWGCRKLWILFLNWTFLYRSIWFFRAVWNLIVYRLHFWCECVEYEFPINFAFIYFKLSFFIVSLQSR